jgi:hypothetical protein
MGAAVKLGPIGRWEAHVKESTAVGTIALLWFWAALYITDIYAFLWKRHWLTLLLLKK